MKNWAAFLPLAALAVLVIVAVVMLTRGGERESFTAGLIGRAAPAFELAALDPGAAPVRSEALAGQAYVVNIFASWCAPCRVEHPLLMQMRDEGVTIIGVAYKDRPENTARFITELGDPYAAIGLDPQGRFGLEMGVAGVPETFVIGADGRVRAVHRGPLTPDVVERTLRPALL